MGKEIVTLNYTLKFEVDEASVSCDNFKEAIEKGFIRIIRSNVELSTEDGVKCEDEFALEQAKQAIMYGLIEKV